MNNKNKAIIRRAIKALEEMQEKLTSIQQDVENVRDETQDTYDNLSESAQDGDRGASLQEEIDALEEACSMLEDIDFDDALSFLYDSIGEEQPKKDTKEEIDVPAFARFLTGRLQPLDPELQSRVDAALAIKDEAEQTEKLTELINNVLFPMYREKDPRPEQ